jgi:hypothetical protein
LPVHFAMTALQSWCRVIFVGDDGAELVCFVLEGAHAPNLGVVDQVARLALLAKRLTVAVVVSDVAPELQALLALTGLCVEMEGQAKGGEETFGLQQSQEERHAGDLPR